MGLLIFFILYLFALVVSLTLLFVFGFLPVIRGAPFFPICKNSLQRAIELADLKPGEKIVDLGSGDGRILIAAARRGAIAYGFEINPFLVWRARKKIKKEGLENLAFCKCRSFWRQDLSSFDIVFVYGINHIMKGLAKKFRRELKPGAKVVAFSFPLPKKWQPQIQERGIYIYQV